MRPFVWHPQTNPFPKTKVDRFFNRKKPFLKMSDTLDDKNSTKQSLAKPSTIHILIPIPLMTQSASYHVVIKI
jgi:hypothetical protein